MDDKRKKALGAALTQIERQFGKGAIMRMGDPGVMRDIEVVSTGWGRVIFRRSARAQAWTRCSGVRSAIKGTRWIWSSQ